MKIPRSELPVITAAVNTAPVKAVPDPPPGPALVAGEAGTRPQDKDVTPVPVRADIGNWPDPM
ncbi:hypothetical protein [Arthrobacter sp. NPDC056727]|uniref:hypothetical protein n=1 Tax=Arthrobacter sp. NPDC056727 TaxID=3345927 RepID=UPI00366C2306